MVSAVVAMIAALLTIGSTPSPDQRLNGVSIMGFTLNNPAFDAIGVLFTNNVRVENNTITGSGCDGIFVIFVIFADGVIINRTR